MGKLREPLNLLYGDNCALPLALEAMGERWSFMILRAAFNGVHHFEEFQQELSIARNILSNRLSKLVDHGIMAREVMAEDRRKVRYELTEKGLELLPAMIALRQWGEKWGSRRTFDPGARRCARRTADRPGDDHRARWPRHRLQGTGVETSLRTAAVGPGARAHRRTDGAGCRRVMRAARSSRPACR